MVGKKLSGEVGGEIFIICFITVYDGGGGGGGDRGPGVATFPQQPVPRDGRLRSNLCSVSETQLNFKTICKHLRPAAAAASTDDVFPAPYNRRPNLDVRLPVRRRVHSISYLCTCVMIAKQKENSNNNT